MKNSEEYRENETPSSIMRVFAKAVMCDIAVIPRNEESPGEAGPSRERTRFARGSFACAQDDSEHGN
jgi:hypothetical protein